MRISSHSRPRRRYCRRAGPFGRWRWLSRRNRQSRREACHSKQIQQGAPPQLQQTHYKSRNVIERCFCRLKDFRRVATRYDKLARNFLAAVHLAAIAAY
ncbi:transposase [Bradyrhizobium paxllaeri]|uniref:transposase n=1 Tax=Bradyrhizobium paxllaeri TaxID=190148 RepID=UPI003D319C18